MVRSDTLDLESADDDQLDLFYLVDCVLDEIERTKAANRKPNIDTDSEGGGDGGGGGGGADDVCDIMPAASNHFHTDDLMDHIESPSHHYDDNDFSYPAYQVPRIFQGAQTDMPVLHTDVGTEYNVPQGMVDFEYMSQMTRVDSATDTVYGCASNKQKADLLAEEYVNISSGKDIIPDEFAPVQSYTYSSKQEGLLRYPDPQRHLVSKPADDQESLNTMHLSREAVKHYNELQSYSDLIQLPDMTPRVDQSFSSQTYADTAVHNSSGNGSLKTQPSYDESSNDTSSTEFVSWTCKHPENWSQTEVLDWLYHSAERNGVDGSLLHGESFRTVNGEMLCKMGPEDFCSLEPNYGQFFYELFRQLVTRLQFAAVSPDRNLTEVEAAYTFTDAHTHVYDKTDSIPQGHCHNNEIGESQAPVCPSPELYQPYQQTSYDRGLPVVVQSDQCPVDDLIMQAYDCSVSAHDTKYDYLSGQYNYTAYQMPQRVQYRGTLDDATSVRSKYENGPAPVRRRPGRPRIKSVPTEEELQAQREKKLKSQHLWEFIFEMLNNPLYNPSILKWENQNEGVFRFIQSEAVAQLWGTLKSNENMTYEKLSRAMRHYYKRGILERVEGRRLVYKFSLVTLARMKEKRNLRQSETL